MLRLRLFSHLCLSEFLLPVSLALRCVCDVVMSLVAPKAAIVEMMINGLTPQTVVAAMVTIGVPRMVNGLKVVRAPLQLLICPI